MSQRVEEERRVVPFTVPSGRMKRRLIADPDARGAVLLFTGVRYDRTISPTLGVSSGKSTDPQYRS